MASLRVRDTRFEALQRHDQNLTDLNWLRYVESRSTLGTELTLPRIPDRTLAERHLIWPLPRSSIASRAASAPNLLIHSPRNPGGLSCSAASRGVLRRMAPWPFWLTGTIPNPRLVGGRPPGSRLELSRSV
jgi:hypothetical protein